MPGARLQDGKKGIGDDEQGCSSAHAHFFPIFHSPFPKPIRLQQTGVTAFRNAKDLERVMYLIMNNIQELGQRHW